MNPNIEEEECLYEINEKKEMVKLKVEEMKEDVKQMNILHQMETIQIYFQTKWKKEE